MNTDSISKETYDRLSQILGKPDEYLKGKVCDYQILGRIDQFFFHNLDKDYLKDYFLIKDWVHFSFYSGYLLKELKKQEVYKEIPIENIELIWNAFNGNKIEKNGKEKDYYKEKRCQYIPEITNLLLKKSSKYNKEKLFHILEELITNMKEEMDSYYLARNTAQIMGNYITTHREIDNQIFEYLKLQQNIKDFDFHLVFYDFKLKSVYNEEKIDKIFSIINEQRQNTTLEEVIKESLKENSFHIIKYIHIKYNYQFNENQLIEIITQQKNYFGTDSLQYVIENFQPVKTLEKVFHQIFSDYKYSSENNKQDFYEKNLEFLKRKVNHDQLNDKLPIKNSKTIIKKI